MSIYDTIREVQADHPTATAEKIRDAIFDAMDAEDCIDGFHELLLPAVREVMRTARNAALDHVFRETTDAPPKKPRSAKVAAVRDWWQAMLDSQINVGDDWKTLGSCTSADLKLVIEDRERRSAQLKAQADRYWHLQHLLEESGVETVADIPRDKVAQLQGGAA